MDMEWLHLAGDIGASIAILVCLYSFGICAKKWRRSKIALAAGHSRSSIP